MNELIQQNAQTIDKELNWLAEVIEARRKIHWKLPGAPKTIHEIIEPNLDQDRSVYATLVHHRGKMGFEERLILILALAPHVRPQVLDTFFIKNETLDRFYTEFGGVKGRYHSGFLPTGETAAFILAGTDIAKRVEVLDLFRPEHRFTRFNILKLDRRDGSEPILSGQLEISEEYLTYLTAARSFKPDFSSNFPAKLLGTRLDWADLVLDPHVLSEIGEISAWIEHQNTIMYDWGLEKQLKRGYRALFYGPPGTGKSLTATLIGKRMNLDVYRIDLSQVVSKYIGETEKNLANIFDQAENKQWVLFFDEADALFGKRTATSDAKDRHANQEVSYLLQRIEDYAGVVILATNLKANMDIAFTRRFQSIVYFPPPTYDQRIRLWKNSFEKVKLAADVDFSVIANDYVLTGGNIVNVLRYCSLSALRRGGNTVNQEDIIEGVKKELRKEGKTL